VIVHYFNSKGIGFDPAEADPPLVVDPNTALPHPIAAEGLQPIFRKMAAAA